MPATNVDLANTANVEASIAMDDRMDMILAICLPILFVLLSLPVTITRMAMMGLNCIAVREEVMETELGNQTLKDDVQKARTGISGRLSTAICCGIMGAVISSLVMIILATVTTVKIISS